MPRLHARGVPRVSRAKRIWLTVAIGGALVTAVPTQARSSEVHLATAESGIASTGGSGPQFSAVCGFSHRLADDPIVHPGHPGASHLHDFFGNTSTNAQSTAATMLTAGTTCRRPEDRSGYWTPVLYNAGKAVQPLRVIAYFRTRGKYSERIVTPPAGLRMIAGAPYVQWRCALPAQPARRVDGPEACTAEEMLDLMIIFPDCWDGRRLDSADHRSHMAYSVDRVCPTTHPVPLPGLDLPVRYPVLPWPREVSLAPLDEPSQPHADFFNAWDQPTLERLVKDCINARVNCGNTGP